MFFVEYTENNERKALNLAMCQRIETEERHISAKSSFYIYIHHKERAKMVLEFKSKEEMLTTFDNFMDALNRCQAHLFSQNVLSEEHYRQS